MKLSRTKEYNFGWLVVFPLIDVVFLLIFFLLLSSNFVFQLGCPAPPQSRIDRVSYCLACRTCRRLLSFSSSLPVNGFAHPSAPARELNQRQYRTRGGTSSMDRCRGSRARVDHAKTVGRSTLSSGKNPTCSFLLCQRTDFERSAAVGCRSSSAKCATSRTRAGRGARPNNSDGRSSDESDVFKRV